MDKIVIDSPQRKVWVGQREVRLSASEFLLLRTLAADPHRIFSKRELLASVWEDYGHPNTSIRTLDSYAARLRRKLDPKHARYVHNCWGVGFRLEDTR